MKNSLSTQRPHIIDQYSRYKIVLLRTLLSLSMLATVTLSTHAQEVRSAPPASSTDVAASNTASTTMLSSPAGADLPKKNDVVFDISKACTVPPYPQPAIRFGLHGDTILKLMIDKNGKIDAFELLKSSGWKMLDMTVMQVIVGCQVIPPGNWIPSVRFVRYKWQFGTGYISPGKLDVTSCKPSEKLRVADDKEHGLGIVVGVYISDKGKVADAKVQWGSDNEERNQESLRIAQSCEFTPAERSGKRIGNAESIRFLPKS